MEPEEKRKDPLYKIEVCWYCLGTSVQATEELCQKWRKEYLDAFNRASQGGAADLAAFHELHRKMSKILADYPACPFCNGEGGIPERLPDDTVTQSPTQQFFEDGDGWLTFDNE